MDLTRRSVMAATAAGLVSVGAGRAWASAETVERWGLYEIQLSGPSHGNPFKDVSVSARFSRGDQTIDVPGFYDGEGTYRVRFSPPEVGNWSWSTVSNIAALNGVTGSVEAAAPASGNHGPVGVVADYHFAHADGTPFRQIGTTSYGWTHQPEAMRRLTVETLRSAPFNKMRMAVFPNASLKTNVGPLPFARTGEGDRDWDATRFDPAFFRRLEACVAALNALNIQADLILFHPYDGRYGFDEMPGEVDDFYLRYVVARLAAYRNVWWSMANEFDILKTKNDADWDRMFQVVKAADPYGRLRSIHNWRRLYDNGEPWVTHSSIQNGSAVLDDARAETYRSVWKKAVIFDEVEYEGSIDQRWGDLSPQQMVSAFWHGLIGGTYVGHSECYPLEPGGGFWLGEGGELRGQSAPRLAFLKSVMEAGPTPGIDPIDKWWEQHLGGVAGQFYLRYFGKEAPTEWAVDLPRDALTGGERFTVEVLDTWNMTVTAVEGEFTMAKKNTYFFHDPSRPTIALPGRQWMAVRVRRAG